MRKKLLYLASMVLAVSVFVGLAQTQPVSATQYTNITICHKNQNHYNQNTVDGSSILNRHGHDSHSGDIIPGFWYKDYNEDIVSLTQPGDWWKWEKYNGKNLGPIGLVTGQAILSNGCVVPPVSVTPSTVTFVDPTCEASGSYTIPAKTGVVYKINGETVAAGTYPAEDGESVTVVAVAAAGYVLTGQKQWSHEFTIGEECIEEQAVINYGVVCGADGATVTLTNTGNISGQATVNGEVIDVEAGATVKRVIDMGKDGLQITIVIGDETVYDQLVDCDKSDVLGVSTVVNTPTVLPKTSGNSVAAAATLISGAGAFVTMLSFAVRRLLTRGI